MEIDVRVEEEIDVKQIRFYDSTPVKDLATVLSKGTIGGLFIDDSDSGDCVFIEDKGHAINLIKALEKAIELGWFE